jgi:hypothetical protein
LIHEYIEDGMVQNNYAIHIVTMKGLNAFAKDLMTTAESLIARYRGNVRNEVERIMQA